MEETYYVGGMGPLFLYLRDRLLLYIKFGFRCSAFFLIIVDLQEASKGLSPTTEPVSLTEGTVMVVFAGMVLILLTVLALSEVRFEIEKREGEVILRQKRECYTPEGRRVEVFSAECPPGFLEVHPKVLLSEEVISFIRMVVRCRETAKYRCIPACEKGNDPDTCSQNCYRDLGFCVDKAVNRFEEKLMRIYR